MSIKKVYLELTNRCNLNCSMCYRNAWDYTTADMPVEILGKCLKEINKIPSVKEVVLGGIGEPTFSMEAEEVMYSLKDKYLTLTTNGTFLHQGMLESIVDCVDHIVISIDGAHDVFYAIRQIPLDLILDNMKALNQLKKLRRRDTPKVSIQMVLSTTNQHQMIQVIDIAMEVQASQVIFSNMLPNSLEEYPLVLYKQYGNGETQKLFQNVRNYALLKGFEIKLPAYELKTERRCRFIEEHSIVINADGDITPCYRFSHDQKEVVFGREKEIKAHSFGNIKDQSLQEIWESPLYKAFRSTVYNNHYPSCIDCDLVDGCDMVRTTIGDCYGNAPSCADCLWSRKMVFCI